MKCDYFRICEQHFEPKSFTKMSKNKLNWNAIPLESAISCISSNRQSEISSTSKHENIRCRTPLMNVNKNTECEASSMSADDINYNEATLSTVYDTSFVLFKRHLIVVIQHLTLTLLLLQLHKVLN